VRRLAIALLAMSGAALIAASSPASAAEDSDAAGDLSVVNVLQVNGLIDPIVADSISDAIAAAEASGAQALVLQLDSKGGVLDDDALRALLTELRTTPVAIGVWVGPASAARAYGQAAQIVAAADVSAMVLRSRLGHSGPLPTIDGDELTFGAATTRLASGSMNFNEARTAGALNLNIADEGVPTITQMLLALDGQTIKGITLNTVVQDLDADGNTQNYSAPTVNRGLGFGDEVMHAMTNPSIAYIMIVIGLALLVFELFTAGVGLAGGIGALCTVLGCYGLAALPTRTLGVALLVLSFVAFAIDVQVGVPRFWTGVGITGFIAGSLLLYESLPGYTVRVGWVMLVVGVVGIALTFFSGMPSMVRTRFATPTIGREWMLGEVGSATTSISPDGVALVSGARWRARTNRATPIAAGESLRVVAIDGVTLEVEPESGGARDYRERRE
jgi:membrane-bound serine protease (ClpP class)